jgi:two-component system chemotaxis response regulator CheY
LTYRDGQVTFALSPLIRGIFLARKILLADDSVTAQNMGRKILADAGYEVIAVNNGSAALKKIAELKPDLVILDVYMPGYSGLEVCQRLKESQETARIPVLLSVGKLEPFKPEEAQRVRADGYIVKPFEASELLSALSKLEDKVVPRAEPSKPGRFARAIAAAEESSRGSEKNTEQNGWKSRIGFPREKTEPEEKAADEASIYNPMNRDLGTVVATGGQKAGETSAQQQEDQARQEAVKASVDVAALVPAGLPKDVTAEEVAAIAAAAAQIQTVEAEAKLAVAADEQRASELRKAEIPIDDQPSAEATPAESKSPTSTNVHDVAAVAVKPHDVEERSAEQSPEQQPEEPVTMAATSDSMGASRWTAVPVALEGEEASLSLEQEMQKVYAAFEAEPAAAGMESEAAVAANSPAAMVEPEPVVQPEAAVSSEPVAVPSGSAEEATPSAVHPGTSPTPEFTESNKAMPVAEFLSPVSEAEVAGLAGLVGLSADSQLAAETEAVSAAPTTPTTTSKPFTRIVRTPENGAEPADEPKPEQEAVKSTAAAWANWRQNRDTGNGGEAAPAQVEPEESQSARAVAAGAEQSAQAPESKNSPGDVASIVDSVLADLRPKLMAEISRKMAEKK